MAAKKTTQSSAGSKPLPVENNQPSGDQIEKLKGTHDLTGVQDVGKVKQSGLSGDRGMIILGAGMLIVGAVLLLGRLVGFTMGEYLWPFIFILPGLIVLFSALASESNANEGVAILGGILTSLGVLFLFQQITGLWASWAYAWALIAPFSVGVSQMIYGNRKNRIAITATGKRLVNLGLIMFAIGLVFFEVILGISGFGLARFNLPVFPIVLIFIGAMVLLRALVTHR